MSSSVKLRRPNEDDIPEIEGIAKNYDFNLPTEFESAAVTVDEDEAVLSFGVLRSSLEAIIYFTGSTKEKVESLRLQIDIAKVDAKNMGFKDFIVFAQDPKFAEALVKHYGFRKMNGVPLILDLE